MYALGAVSSFMLCDTTKRKRVKGPSIRCWWSGWMYRDGYSDVVVPSSRTRPRSIQSDLSLDGTTFGCEYLGRL